MSDNKLCQYCGESIKSGAVKCKHCHSMLEGENQAAPAIPARKKQVPREPVNRQVPGPKKPIWKRWWAWTAAIFLFFILVGALSGSGDDAQQAAPEPEAVETEPAVEDVAEVPEEEVDVPEEETAAAEASVEATDSATLGEKNAVQKAKDYLAFTAFSYSGLVEQLKYEGFTHDEAVYGVDRCGADWNEQALLKAKSYLAYTAFSYSGLVEQLKFEGFTQEQAVYGVDRCGADWNEQAALKAQSYLDYSSFSSDGLLRQLEFEGFTRQQAEYGVQAVGY